MSHPVLSLASFAVALTLAACTGEKESRRPAASTPAPIVDERLLPDMTALPASSVRLVSEDGERVLRFGTTLANTGKGPLEVVPVPDAPCPEGQRFFAQEIVLDADANGTYAPATDSEVAREGGACALFHPEHEHWHIDGSARYELKDLAGTSIVTKRKVSFCLRDTARVAGAATVGKKTYGKCSRDALQGISPGWSDLYGFDLPGQTLRIPDSLDDGTYCLVLTSDPFDYFVDADEDNNASVTPIRIDGDTAEATRSTVCAAA